MKAAVATWTLFALLVSVVGFFTYRAHEADVARTRPQPQFWIKQRVSLHVLPAETGMVLGYDGWSSRDRAHCYTIRLGRDKVSVLEFELFSHTKESKQ